MCGIIQGISKHGHKVGKSTLKRYEMQKSRGSEGFGYCVVEGGKVRREVHQTENGIRKLLKQERSSMVMFHHRLPTSTVNVDECCHPIFVEHDELEYSYYVVHNGVIRNDDELKKKHEGFSTPYVYNTLLTFSSKSVYKSNHTGKEYNAEVKDTYEYNDSECFAIELARYLDGITHKIDCFGNIAFVCWKVKKDGTFVSLHYGHNEGNPLMIDEDNNNIWIKSEGGKSLEENIIYNVVYNANGTEETQTSVDIGYLSEYKRNPTTAYNIQKNLPVIQTLGKDYGYYDRDYKGAVGFRTHPLDDDFDDITDISEYSGTDKYMNEKEEMIRENKILNMVKEYHELTCELQMSEEDLLTAQNMLTDNIDEKSRDMLQQEIEDVKERMGYTVKSMEKIEEDYHVRIGGTKDFMDLVEDYQEEIDEFTKEMEEESKREVVCADGKPM